MYNSVFVFDNFTFKKLDSRSCTLVSLIKDAESVEIPQQIKINSVRLTVTSIENKAFLDSKVKSIKLPPTIKSIGDRAFYNCRCLESINIPLTTKSIGEYCFTFCVKLKNIKIYGVKTINAYCFYGCENLKTVKLSKNLISICHSSFEMCTSIENIYIPNGIKWFGSRSFCSCKSLKKVYLPKSVISLGSLSFDNCENLKVLFKPTELKLALWDVPKTTKIIRF